MSKGIELIAEERKRQIEEEGYDRENDKVYVKNELPLAAATYALPETQRGDGYIPLHWPWSPKDWKPAPDDRIKELQKAGALIAAEIDRLIALSRGYEDGYKDGMEEAFRWRDANKELPEQYKEVLLKSGDFRYVGYRIIEEQEGFFYWVDGRDDEITDVTHWRPIELEVKL